MLVYYKEKKIELIISILLVILDGIIVYYIPSYFNNISYLYPMLTISFIPFLIRKKKHNIYLIIIIGLLYDLLYSNIFLYNVFIFCLLAYINNLISHYFKDSLLLFVSLGIINIVIYDTITFILVMITSYQTITLNDLLYKIENSILLNFMSIIFFYFWLKKYK